jgi:hypothetical protein
MAVWLCLSTLPLCAAGACEPYYRRILARYVCRTVARSCLTEGERPRVRRPDRRFCGRRTGGALEQTRRCRRSVAPRYWRVPRPSLAHGGADLRSNRCGTGSGDWSIDGSTWLARGQDDKRGTNPDRHRNGLYACYGSRIGVVKVMLAVFAERSLCGRPLEGPLTALSAGQADLADGGDIRASGGTLDRPIDNRVRGSGRPLSYS